MLKGQIIVLFCHFIDNEWDIKLWYCVFFANFAAVFEIRY